MIYLQYLKNNNYLNMLFFPFSLRKQKHSFWASQKKSNVGLKLLVWRVNDWPLKLWSERLGHQWSLQNTEVMESVIISPGNYVWKKEWLVVGMSTLLQDVGHQNLQEDWTEIFKCLSNFLCAYQTCIKIQSRILLSEVLRVRVVVFRSLAWNVNPPTINMAYWEVKEGRD